MSNQEDYRAEALRKANAVRCYKPHVFESTDEADFVSIVAALMKFPNWSVGPGAKVSEPDPKKKYGHVRIAGRVTLRRDAGKKLIFLTVQDRSEQMQVAINASVLPDMEEFRKGISVFDVMGFEGDLAVSNSGEPTLWVTEPPVFFAKSLLPAPDKVEGVSDKEMKYRHRYLDLICNHDSMRRFVTRSQIISQIRQLLTNRRFVEVETPVLQTVPNGATARPFETKLNALDLSMTLRIATEIALKKLLVGGMERVYEIGRIFRNEGIDKTHNPEFTSIELYQAYASLDNMRLLTQEIVQAAQVGSFSMKQEKDRNPLQFAQREFMDLIKEHAGISDPWDPVETRRVLKEKRRIEERQPVDLNKEKDETVLDALFSEFVEAKLQSPCFVFRQPIGLSPLCAPSADPRLAERFEMYMNGMEIANAYQELNDPVEQRKRLAEQGIVDEEFIEALEYGMPSAGGLGIGIDRLVMAVTGAETIKDVILFPMMRPQ